MLLRIITVPHNAFSVLKSCETLFYFELRLYFFFISVCAEAYNPDEEEDDAESRVFNALSQILFFFQFSGIKFRKKIGLII